MPDLDSARATIHTIVFDALICRMPRGSYDFLEQAAKVATASLEEPSIAWALKMVAEQGATDV